jgi:hypothetical protein
MKDFIPFKDAFELKQLGFDEPCFAHFLNKKFYSKSFDRQGDGITLSPTFSQSFRFFRKNYGLFISFVRYRKSVVIEMPDTFSKVYEIWIQDENKDESIWVGSFDGQEEAELACLRKLIEIVKQKQ